jgi:Asp-tRNA(Asn)/Glu-tRNA(Gln) amidotransferase C subunit
LKDELKILLLKSEFNISQNEMTQEQLQKLLKLTAIELPEDQKPAFLNYFNSMKAMFDDFASFPLSE